MTLNCPSMKTENDRGGIYSYLLKTWKVFTKYDFFYFLGAMNRFLFMYHLYSYQLAYNHIKCLFDYLFR